MDEILYFKMHMVEPFSTVCLLRACEKELDRFGSLGSLQENDTAELSLASCANRGRAVWGQRVWPGVTLEATLTRNLTCQQVDEVLIGSRTVRKSPSLNPPNLCYFVWHSRLANRKTEKGHNCEAHSTILSHFLSIDKVLYHMKYSLNGN